MRIRGMIRLIGGANSFGRIESGTAAFRRDQSDQQARSGRRRPERHQREGQRQQGIEARSVEVDAVHHRRGQTPHQQAGHGADPDLAKEQPQRGQGVNMHLVEPFKGQGYFRPKREVLSLLRRAGSGAIAPQELSDEFGSVLPRGVSAEVLCPFLEAKQEQSGDDCLEADCSAPLIHYES